jgi:predicted nucleic acid-binding protein
MSKTEEIRERPSAGLARPRHLVDTGVIVDRLRGYVDVYEWFRRFTNQAQTPQSLCSVVTVAELFSGLSSEAPKSGEAVVNRVSQMDIIPVCKNIACSAGVYVQKWGVSHGVGFSDSLITATAC